MVILTESILKLKNVVVCVETKTYLSRVIVFSGYVVKLRLLKSLTVSVVLFKQIIAISPIRRGSSQYFTDRCPLDPI